MNDCLYIVMPAYNEEENIREVIRDWYKILAFADENSKLVVADGGSKDNTLNILYELQKKYPKLEVLSRPGTDHGTKVILLYKYAIEHGAKWVFQTDSDGQTDSSEFEAFWKDKDRFDAIIGVRKKREDGTGRKLVETVLRIYLLLFFGKMVPDANAPFRLMKTDVVNKYIDIFDPTFNLPNAVLTECFVKYNDKVDFRQITFRPRQGGQNFMNPKRIWKIGVQSAKNFSELKKRLDLKFSK